MKFRYLIVLIVMLFVKPLLAEDLLMVRSHQAFPEAMVALQQAISDKGYKITRVQRVDIGLTGMGYKTDKYRVVFFTKLDEIRELSAKHPELIPYLPPKISIFAEDNQTVLVATNPTIFKNLYPAIDLAVVFDRWEQDIRNIFETVRLTE